MNKKLLLVIAEEDFFQKNLDGLTQLEAIS
jgi:hypothetical protein